MLWLVLMYIRTFKPADESNGQGWILRGTFHSLAWVGVVVIGMYTMLALVHAFEEGHGFAYYFSHHFISFGATIALLAALVGFARTRGKVDFGEANAIDVESMREANFSVDRVDEGKVSPEEAARNLARKLGL